MHAPIQSAKLSSYSHSLSHTIVRHPTRLLALRLSWLMFMAAYLLIAGLGIAVLYDSFREGGTPLPVFGVLFVQNDFLAVYSVVTSIIVVLSGTLIAAIIYYRASDSWLIWIVSVTTLIGAVSSSNLQLAVAIAYPQLQWLTWFLTYLAVLVFAMYSWIFPNGQIVPKWLRWFVPVEIVWWLIMSIPLIPSITLSVTTEALILNLRSASLLVSALVCIGAQTYRFRTASIIERQQLKWAFLALIIYFISFSISVLGINYLLPTYDDFIWQLLAQLVLFSLPNYGAVIAMTLLAFSITRYRLYAIDLVINKSLVYSSLVALALFIFFGVLVVLQVLIGQQQPLIALAIAGGFSAAIFRPVKNRVQNWVDRYIYRFNFNLNELVAAQKLPEISNPGLLSGKKLDDYEVRDVLGQGGMGEVYQGFGNGRTVAIKTMLPKIAQDPDMRKRFEREAQVGILLDHPNIAKVYSYGDIEGTPYLVMAYIEGQDLSHLLRTGGRLDEETTSCIMQDICAALELAHNKGYIHRDLKPSNIMIQPNGQAILMDFGITKMTDASSSLTGTGAVGTIDYMAPEQIMSAKEVDKRADIYALGVVLYEMLTGEKPFKGSVPQILFAHLQQPVPDAQDIKPDIPYTLAQATRRAMSKNPEDRFQSVGEFAAALSACTRAE
jgi:tRNA A-37 threonylcarbamoyl transferase component Bud32